MALSDSRIKVSNSIVDGQVLGALTERFPSNKESFQTFENYALFLRPLKIAESFLSVAPLREKRSQHN